MHNVDFVTGESGMYMSMLLCMCALCAFDPTDGRVRVRC